MFVSLIWLAKILYTGRSIGWDMVHVQLASKNDDREIGRKYAHAEFRSCLACFVCMRYRLKTKTCLACTPSPKCSNIAPFNFPVCYALKLSFAQFTHCLVGSPQLATYLVSTTKLGSSLLLLDGILVCTNDQKLKFATSCTHALLCMSYF
jgi:hypothetical protein